MSASTAHILGEVCREKQEAAIPLVRLFLHYGKIVPFISAIAHAEINRTQWVWPGNAASRLAVVKANTSDQNNAVSDLIQSLSNRTHSSPLRRDPNTIFRGNSLTSKCIDETMKLAGMHYLQVTLKPIIDEVRRSILT